MLSTSAFIKRPLRVALRGVLRCALRLRSSPYLLSPGAVTLVLAPHQDDEALGCGGLIALRRRAADPVHVAYLTDGAGSHPNHPTLAPAELAELRRAEAYAALRSLNVEHADIHFLSAPDGHLNRLTPLEHDTLVSHLTRLFDEVNPHEILLPFRYDGSSEHEAAFILFEEALRRSRCSARVLEFPVWSWWNPLILFRQIARLGRVTRFRFSGYEFLKHAALAEYRSQVLPTPPWTEPVLSRDFVAAFQTGEEFFFER